MGALCLVAVIVTIAVARTVTLQTEPSFLNLFIVLPCQEHNRCSCLNTEREFTLPIKRPHPLIQCFHTMRELGEGSVKPRNSAKSGWFMHLWKVQESRKKATGFVALLPLMSGMTDELNELRKAERGTATVSVSEPRAGTGWTGRQFLFF